MGALDSSDKYHWYTYVATYNNTQISYINDGEANDNRISYVYLVQE